MPPLDSALATGLMALVVVDGRGTTEALVAGATCATVALRDLGRGASNTELVSKLHLSLSTIKTHVASILFKLDLRDRVQAAILACEADLS